MNRIIQDLLAQQRDLTAVERFANRKEAEGHSMERYYRDLIPTGPPGVGEQYGFEVDLDKCSGCKACVTACHSLNGLEFQEAWRDVGLIIGNQGGKAHLQTVTTACHHCVEPGCLEGCPVKAYEKDEKTGIVRHLDDQCIGCQYCVMKCPYDVPKFSERLGIVRKCDMCHDRLSAGEAPACVQACPHQAIAIRVVNKAAVKEAAVEGSQMLPGAFDSSYTKPSTNYKSAKPIPAGTRAADGNTLRLDHAHWPLIVMLVLSQLSAGALVALAVLGWCDGALFAKLAKGLTVAAFGILNVGLVASVFHLGRPMGAWRFFLGLRTSWMSREILLFSIFAGASSAAAGASWFFPGLALPAVTGAAVVGLLAVFTSVMIYVDTHRAFWSFSLTMTRFYGSALALGAAAVAIGAAVAGSSGGTQISAGAIVVLLLAMFAVEEGVLRNARLDRDHPLHRPARTIQGLLPRISAASGLMVGIALVFLFLSILGLAPVVQSGLAFAALLGFVVTQRYIFFTAVCGSKMPGGV